MTQERDSISRNAGFALAVKMTGAVFTAALTLVLVRVLGPAQYGVFALAMSIGGLVFLPSDLGIAQAAARYVAERHGDRGAVAAIISDAVRLKLLAGGVISLALVALAGPIADAYGTPDLAWPLRILAVSLFAESFVLLWNALFQAFGRISVYLRVVVLESASEATLSIAIVLLGGGAAGAMVGRTAAYLFAAGYGLMLVGRTVGARVSARRSAGGGHVKRIAGYGSALLIIDGAVTLFSRLDAILIGAFLSVAAVGKFEAPIQLAGLLGYVGQSVSSGVAPRMARTATGEPDVPALERGLVIVLLIQGLFLAPLLVWAEPIVSLVLGPDYEESADVLRALAPYAFLVGVSPMLSLSVNYLGEAKRRIPIAIAALAINVAIDIALLTNLGIVAAAIGTDIGYTFYVVAHLLVVKRLVGLSLRPVAVNLVRALLAAAVMSAVLFAIGTGDVALPLLILGAPAGAAAYLAALLALRAISPADVRHGAARLRAIARPGVR